MLIKIRSQVQIGALNGIEQQLGNAMSFNIDKMWLKEHFRRFEPLTAELDDSTVWQNILFGQKCRLFGKHLFLFTIVSNIAHLLFEHPDRFKIGSMIERIATK